MNGIKERMKKSEGKNEIEWKNDLNIIGKEIKKVSTRKIVGVA